MPTATYMSDKPCRRGHLAPRLMSSGNCTECNVIVNRQWREQNRDRKRESNRAWAKANPEKASASSQKWHAANVDREKAENKARYRADPKYYSEINARSRAKHLDARLATERAWRERNPDKLAAAVHRRRARRQGAASGCRIAHAKFMRWAQTAKSIPCYWCGVKTPPGVRKRHVDHIIPLSRGGSDAVENLCVACAPCNMSKGSRMPEEFAGQSELRFA